MVRMKAIPGQEHLAFPKKKKVPKQRKADTPEAIIQMRLEKYLDMTEVRYIRIPDCVYRLFTYTSIPVWVKQEMSSAFKGVPDLLCFKKSGDYNTSLLVEVKTDVGKLSQGQKKWHQGLNVAVVRSFEEGKDIIDRFKEVNDDKE
jgi:hypothetical protein